MNRTCENCYLFISEDINFLFCKDCHMRFEICDACSVRVRKQQLPPSSFLRRDTTLYVKHANDNHTSVDLV